jgi:hypothetical protein
MAPAYMVFVNRKGILLKGTAPLVLLGFVQRSYTPAREKRVNGLHHWRPERSEENLHDGWIQWRDHTRLGQSFLAQ